MYLSGFLLSPVSHWSKFSFQGLICLAFQGCIIQLDSKWQPDPTHCAVGTAEATEDSDLQLASDTQSPPLKNRGRQETAKAWEEQAWGRAKESEEVVFYLILFSFVTHARNLM